MEYQSNNTSNAQPCFCIGPQKGQPFCPCKMRNVTIKNGRYIEEIDLGPVKTFELPAWPINESDNICLHDAFDRDNPEMKGKPRWISCPCPKCTPR